jgi:oxygen-independent coproporphyrinogen III oxidase
VGQDTSLPQVHGSPGTSKTLGVPLRPVVDTLLAGGAFAPREQSLSLYMHIPFCFHKCHYCDFYSIVDTRDRQAPFTDRLIQELAALAPLSLPSRSLATIFVGGGTPSILRLELWERILRTLAEHFDLSRLAEFTVECNPETVTPELMQTLHAGGVTRVSIGAQTFNPRHLKTLERWHDPQNVLRAIELARAAGIQRQSLDLIFAIPGQTIEEWDSDLRAALSAGTTHISAYALTYEPNTAMTARLARGEFPKADEDLEADLFEHTLATLREAGLDRYEVSNFAAPGQECLHNLTYWRQGQWLAAGPSASAHVAGHRWKNTPRLDDYLHNNDGGLAHVHDLELPDPLRAITERLLTGLRLREGVDAHDVLRQAEEASPGAHARLTRTAERQASLGAMTLHGSRWTLTDPGFLIANRVILSLVEALDPPH